jgi:WD40 repeat protein
MTYVDFSDRGVYLPSTSLFAGVKMFTTLWLTFRLLQLVSTLQHEKSFMFDSSVSSVYAVAVCNGSLLLTSSNDILQRDIETGNVQRRFVAHSGTIRSFLVVNGSRMITSGWDDMIIVWDLVSGSVLRRISLGVSNTYPKSIQLVKNNLFVFGQDSRLRYLNMVSGRVVQSIGNPSTYSKSIF